MSSRVLVCPPDDALLSRLSGHGLILRCEDPRSLADVVEQARRPEVELSCILLRSRAPLACLRLDPGWRLLPLAVHVPGAGSLREVLAMVPELRQFKLKLFLPAERQENLSAVRILASLGIDSGLTMPEAGADWESLADLMTYALLGMIPHAPIEPFAFIADHYAPNSTLDFGAVWFEDPSRYLHLDAEGRIALSAGECERGEFAGHVDRLDELETSAAYQERSSATDRHFLSEEGCAYCPGWRVCLGKFAGEANNGRRCAAFFEELMEVVEEHLRLHAGGEEPWRL
ncbi:MAG: hypothetical protein ACE5F1_05690 [Planctomycetota bacterium]